LTIRYINQEKKAKKKVKYMKILEAAWPGAQKRLKIIIESHKTGDKCFRGMIDSPAFHQIRARAVDCHRYK
jgi:hypothetical protein